MHAFLYCITPFALSVREKYKEVVCDTLHASFIFAMRMHAYVYNVRMYAWLINYVHVWASLSHNKCICTHTHTHTHTSIVMVLTASAISSNELLVEKLEPPPLIVHEALGERPQQQLWWTAYKTVVDDLIVPRSTFHTPLPSSYTFLICRLHVLEPQGLQKSLPLSGKFVHLEKSQCIL